MTVSAPLAFRIALIAACASAALAQSSSVTGRLQSASGAPIAGITVHVATTTISAVSSATGAFTLSGMANNRNADIEVVTLGTWAPTTFRVRPNGALNVGNVTLAPGALISGQVLGSSGLSPSGGNMNAYDVVGTKLFTPNDAIDATGHFAITVPLGYNIIRAVPPVAVPLCPAEWKYTNVTGPIVVPTQTMLRGYPVTGTVVDDVSGVPLTGIKIATWDALTGTTPLSGTEIAQLNATTNAFGQLSFMLPFGVADIEFMPATGDGHMPTVKYGVVTTGINSIGTVRIKRAVILSGIVSGPNGPVANADIDVYDQNGFKLYTPKDNTNISGIYSVRVPTGNLRVTAQPPLATGAAGCDSGYVSVLASTVVSLTAPAGFPVSGRVLDANGQPIANANLNVYDPITGAKIIVTGDHADALGNYSMLLPGGTWNLTATAPQGSSSNTGSLPGLVVAGAVVQDITLPQKRLITNVTSLCMFTVPQGGYLPINILVHNLQPTFLSTLIEVVIQGPNGVEVPIFPQLPIDVLPQFPLLLGPVFMPVPFLPAGMLGEPIRYMIRFRDPATNQVIDEALASFVAV